MLPIPAEFKWHMNALQPASDSPHQDLDCYCWWCEILATDSFFIVSVGNIKRLRLNRKPSLSGFIQCYLKVIIGLFHLCVSALNCLLLLLVIRSCWLCQESEIWKSAFLASRCLPVLNQLCQGGRGVKSDRNVNTGENGGGWTFKEKHSRRSSPPWQTKQFASVTPAVVKWLEWKFMRKWMVLLL